MTDKAATTRIKLIKNHTHAGRDHKAGETIAVDAASAQWLLTHKVGERAAPIPPPAPARPAPSAAPTPRS